MKRADALAHIRIAGYHDDDKAAMRIYVENRISAERYRNAFQDGQRAKAAGVKCECHRCKQENQQ